MVTTLPYCSWPSPLTADLLATGGTRLGSPRLVGREVWWTEGIATEGGRQAIVRTAGPVALPPAEGAEGSAAATDRADGVTAAEKIGEENLAPVVMLTAFSQSELVERARDAGAMAYVVKPFTPADLLPAVEIAISRHQQIVQLESEIADLGERFETRKRVDRAK